MPISPSRALGHTQFSKQTYIMTECSENSNRKSVSHQQNGSSKMFEKYGLRPRSGVKRLGLSRPSSSSRPVKSRPPPLSKYRRKTANARERHRMKEINDAFQTLRQILPEFCCRRTEATMTKIMTLRLAVNYIRALSHLLEETQPDNLSLLDGLQVSITLPSMQEVKCLEECSIRIEKSVDPFSRNTFSPSPGNLTADNFSNRCTLESTNGFPGLYSDDSSILEDNLNAFDDIPVLNEADPLALLLESEGEG
ncbi:hypothetical protein SK128_010486, partial [Halocaridina rubra]